MIKKKKEVIEYFRGVAPWTGRKLLAEYHKRRLGFWSSMCRPCIYLVPLPGVRREKEGKRGAAWRF
jgi:hypothetical protein